MSEPSARLKGLGRYTRSGWSTVCPVSIQARLAVRKGGGPAQPEREDARFPIYLEYLSCSLAGMSHTGAVAPDV